MFPNLLNFKFKSLLYISQTSLEFWAETHGNPLCQLFVQ